ncbi:MAG: succinyl-diaminopimelate desuccinylase [Pseudomonadales bacterium]|nr:succinyl-diaminopimelate desuccinylase [Pseudomonadales bacterium]
MTTLALTQSLIEKASVTPEDEGCQPLMMERLTAAGFDCTPLRFGDVDNFWAVYAGADTNYAANNKGPIMCFAGHTDVVPTGPVENWQSHPFKPEIRDGILYGRGAADMKASLAAMIVAAENFAKANPTPKGRVAFLITSDEEGPAINGTVKVLAWLADEKIKMDYCLVGEPSSTNTLGDVIKNGRRGSLGCKLTVKGIQGHIAYPHLAKNPIHLATPALTELAAEVWDQGNDSFPATTFQISNINGGTGVTNVIPGTVEIIFNFRFSTELTSTLLKERSEAILDKHGFDYDIEWNLSGEPFLTAEGSLVEATVKAIKIHTGLNTELSTAGGTSDGRFIAPYGVQVVELGPINATIHKIDECVAVDALEPLTAIYQEILVELCS